MRYLWPFFALVLAASCGRSAEPQLPPDPPVMHWDHRAEAPVWTAATRDALAIDGGPLTDLVPSDIGTWCPAYPKNDARTRGLFWAGLLSTLAKHESTWNPRAIGGGGRWFGLVQIAPATARWHGCAVGTGEALLDGEANLRCAVRIAARQVPKRGDVARGMRDWGPFHSSSKRAEMSAWTRSQSYCRVVR